MNFTLILFLLSPVLMGYLLVQIILPAPVSSSENHSLMAERIFRLFLAPGIGYGLVSLLFFLWSLLFSPTRSLAGYLMIEILLLIVFLILFLSRRQRNSWDKVASPAQKNWISLSLVMFAALVLTLFLLNFLNNWQALSLDKPFGDWDAWAIWNLRAGFIASGDDWLKGFSSAILWSHPDYPLLLPLNVARGWVLEGQRSVYVPILLGLVLQLALAGSLSSVVALKRGWLQGLLAGVLGIAILSVSLDFRQYADIPLAFYYLAGNALLYLEDASTHKQPGLTILAGFALGAALWTKNEGWILLGVALAVRLLLDLFSHKSLLQIARWVAWLLAGLLPFLIAILYFKFALAPPNDLLSELSIGAMKSKLIDLSRYLTIFKALRNQFFGYGGLVIPLLPMLLVYPIFAGFRIPNEELRAVLGLALRVIGLSIAYFLVYLFTPKPLTWHLSTSLVRLITQILPSALLLYFLVVSSPVREAFNRQELLAESPPD